ncbi:GNAT family N-acetyltransferase [Desertihabitans aurantiacus]|uniref:GNAT family N-acetyltransferase n=1 Tax=Desertihabitans aurantiacus TaxID=2282477 RepID=UPI000DF831AF|nr:GNAT family N-acetyltransferase [Desertihabitans aurantiacus]
MTPQTGRWRIDVPTPADAGEWVEVHLQALAETYPQLPPGFVGQRRAARDRLVTDLEAELADPGPARHLVARDDDGRVVGIARSTCGGEDWERRLLSSYPDADALGLSRPPGMLQLTSLYTLATVHGGGAGAALADALLGEHACYLWIMTGNPRAEAFYRRRGFVRVSVDVPSGPTWYGWPMFQMAREGSPLSR